MISFFLDQSLVLSDDIANIIDGITIDEECLLFDTVEDVPLGQGNFNVTVKFSSYKKCFELKSRRYVTYFIDNPPVAP